MHGRDNEVCGLYFNTIHNAYKTPKYHKKASERTKQQAQNFFHLVFSSFRYLVVVFLQKCVPYDIDYLHLLIPYFSINFLVLEYLKILSCLLGIPCGVFV